jgi:hypothetical protein
MKFHDWADLQFRLAVFRPCKNAADSVPANYQLNLVLRGMALRHDFRFQGVV